MIQNFAIDQAATFESLLFLSCEPKTAFGDSYRQETTKDGTPKWEAQLVARFRQFGRATNEIIKVGLTSPSASPPRTSTPATPVRARRLRDRRDGQEGPRRQRHRRPGLVPLPGGPLHRLHRPALASRRGSRSPRRRRHELADARGVPRRRPGAVLPAPPTTTPRAIAARPARRRAGLRRLPGRDRVPALGARLRPGLRPLGRHHPTDRRAIRRARAGRRPGPGRRRRADVPRLLAAVRRCPPWTASLLRRLHGEDSCR